MASVFESSYKKQPGFSSTGNRYMPQASSGNKNGYTTSLDNSNWEKEQALRTMMPKQTMQMQPPMSTQRYQPVQNVASTPQMQNITAMLNSLFQDKTNTPTTATSWMPTIVNDDNNYTRGNGVALGGVLSPYTSAINNPDYINKLRTIMGIRNSIANDITAPWSPTQITDTINKIRELYLQQQQYRQRIQQPIYRQRY